MKFIYKAALLICSSVFAMSVQAAGMPQSSKHAQRGVNCTQCHTTGKFEPVETKQCQTCHNQDQLAQKTDRLNYISRMKNPKTGEVKEHRTGSCGNRRKGQRQAQQKIGITQHLMGAKQ